MDTDDGSWVFDSLVCFLNGPVWNAPLQSFIEEKSIIFEPNLVHDPECKIIHDEFKNLVDLMLGTYMEDIGITPEQFEVACSKQYTSELPLQFHKNLFEQIWAANDYEIFKRMMCQKNIELQLQALELIETQYGITPNLFRPQSRADQQQPRSASTSPKNSAELQEELVMDEVKKEVKFNSRPPDAPTEELKKISTEYQHHLHDELEIKKQELQDALRTAISEATASNEIKETPIDLSPPSVSSVVPKIMSAKIDEDELKRRQEYLNAQRDKLVALKKQVREKQLRSNIDGGAREQRPKSAKVAEAVLAGNPENEPHSLQIRRALAERLRSEVVSHKE